MELTDVLHFLTVLGAGIPAGSQVIMAVHTAPTLAGLSSDRAYEMHDELLHHEGHNTVAAAPSIVAAVSGVVLIVLDGVGNLAGAFTLVGVLGVAGVAVNTMTVAARLNNRIRALRGATERPAYAQIQRRWVRGHLIRTTLGVVAFASFTVAALAA